MLTIAPYGVIIAVQDRFFADIMLKGGNDMAYIKARILCGHCNYLIRTVSVSEGSSSTTSGTCTCPGCKKRVRFAYNGCGTIFFAS